jgi:hypothetical protein
MHPSAGAHSVDASKPGDLGSGTRGNGCSASSTSTRFAAKAVSTAFSALASMGVSGSHSKLTSQTSFACPIGLPAGSLLRGSELQAGCGSGRVHLFAGLSSVSGDVTRLRVPPPWGVDWGANLNV